MGHPIGCFSCSIPAVGVALRQVIILIFDSSKEKITIGFYIEMEKHFERSHGINCGNKISLQHSPTTTRNVYVQTPTKLLVLSYLLLLEL
jgi:hypothetical protein